LRASLARQRANGDDSRIWPMFSRARRSRASRGKEFGARRAARQRRAQAALWTEVRAVLSRGKKLFGAR